MRIFSFISSNWKLFAYMRSIFILNFIILLTYWTFLNVCSRSLFDFWVFRYKTIIFVNRNALISSSFPILTKLISFFYLIGLVNSSNEVLNNSGKSEHPFFPLTSEGMLPVFPHWVERWLRKETFFKVHLNLIGQEAPNTTFCLYWTNFFYVAK